MNKKGFVIFFVAKQLFHKKNINQSLNKSSALL